MTPSAEEAVEAIGVDTIVEHVGRTVSRMRDTITGRLKTITDALKIGKEWQGPVDTLLTCSFASNMGYLRYYRVMKGEGEALTIQIISDTCLEGLRNSIDPDDKISGSDFLSAMTNPAVNAIGISELREPTLSSADVLIGELKEEDAPWMIAARLSEEREMEMGDRYPRINTTLYFLTEVEDVTEGSHPDLYLAVKKLLRLQEIAESSKRPTTSQE